MPAHRPGRYHVAHIGRDWHVLFAPKDLPNHFLSVARFQDRERAEGYAGVENDLDHDEECQNSDVRAAASVAPPAPSPRLATTTLPRPPRPEANAPLGELDAALAARLRALMEKYPFGISAKEVASTFDEPEHRARQAMRTLDAQGLARLSHWPDDQSDRLMPLDYRRPPMRLSEPQRAVLEALKGMASPDGLAQASARTIVLSAGVSQGGIIPILDALQVKGMIEIAEKGSNGNATTYRMLKATAPDASSRPAAKIAESVVAPSTQIGASAAPSPSPKAPAAVDAPKSSAASPAPAAAPYAPTPKAVEPSSAPAPVGRPRTHAEIIEAARLAVPAPTFSRPGGATVRTG